MPQPAQVSPGRLVIISNRLPVSVTKDGGGFKFRPSVGGVATALNALRGEGSTLWVGWPGLSTRSDAARKELEKDLRGRYGCHPVFIPRKDFEAYYDGFSNACLWPLFHYFPQYAQFPEESWRAYGRVNRMFCNQVLAVAQPGDRFWVHDYHLMLLPGMLRKALPEAQIGFFLHIPFPAFEMFRMLPWREEVLEGLLGADLVGFHTFGYVQHFFSSLLRLLGMKQDFGTLLSHDRPVKADTFPLGIDVERFSGAGNLPAVKTALRKFRRQCGRRKVVLSVDRLDFTKGIPNRIEAFELFLERHPEWRERVVLVSLCVPSRTRVAPYAALKRQVDELVGRVNGRFGMPGWTPIVYLYREMPFEELTALYLLADAALVTPLRDGMNLVAKEYLATRSEATGVLVLAETAGAAEELGEALIVNPRDVGAVADALDRALNMPLPEQQARNGRMLGRLRRYDTRRWAADFLQQLEGAVREREKYRLPLLVGERRDRLIAAYRAARRRLILLDYDGTLVPLAPTPEQARPDAPLLALLRSLADDPANTLVILSGRNHAALQDWLGKVGANLVAEHGARYRPSRAARWTLDPQAQENAWRNAIRPVMEVYADRTPGAWVEDKGTALAWHYRLSDPDLGWIRAKELMDSLVPYVSDTPLHVLPGEKVVEVKHSSVTKGMAARRWLRLPRPYDFILALGDDQTDEELFKLLPQEAYTVRVGLAQASFARFKVLSVKEVLRLLAALGGESAPPKEPPPRLTRARSGPSGRGGSRGSASGTPAGAG